MCCEHYRRFDDPVMQQVSLVRVLSQHYCINTDSLNTSSSIGSGRVPGYYQILLVLSAELKAAEMEFADKPRTATELYCEVMNKVTRHTSLVRCVDQIRTDPVAAMIPKLRLVLYMYNMCSA